MQGTGCVCCGLALEELAHGLQAKERRDFWERFIERNLDNKSATEALRRNSARRARTAGACSSGRRRLSRGCVMAGKWSCFARS
jgi:hypothetical protein